jgi:hypothetical protein
VLVPGFPGLEFDDHREAKAAYRRLKKADRRRNRSSLPQAAPAYPHASTDPAVVREPARQQPSSTSQTFPVVGAACGGEDQLTNEGRTQW